MDVGVVIGLVVSSISGMVAALFAWLSARDKLRYDAKMVALEGRVTDLQADHDSCQERAAANEGRIRDLETQRHKDATEIGELRGQVASLQLALQLKSGSHARNQRG